MARRSNGLIAKTRQKFKRKGKRPGYPGRSL
jgi:hypothetical protein